MKLQKVYILIEHDVIFGVYNTQKLAMKIMKENPTLHMDEQEVQIISD